MSDDILQGRSIPGEGYTLELINDKNGKAYMWGGVTWQEGLQLSEQFNPRRRIQMKTAIIQASLYKNWES